MKKLLCCLSLMMLVLLTAAAQAVPVTDGLIIHLRADDLTHLNDGDHVTSWPDGATFQNTADGTTKPVTGIDTPILKTNILNGYPVVRFDGADLLCSSNFMLPDDDYGLTIFAKFTGGGSGDITERMAQVGRNDGNSGQVVGLDVSTNKVDTNGGSGYRFNNGAAIVKAANPLTTGFHTGAWKAAEGEQHQNQKYYVDGVLQTFDSLTNPTNVLNLPSVTNTIFSVGDGMLNGGWIAGDYYTGDLAEILVYNAQLTDKQIQQVMKFLDYKYIKATAHNPSPAHKAVNQGTIVNGEVSISFSWNTGLDPNDLPNVNPRITNHYFYLSAPNEPNFIYSIPVPTATASYGPINLKADKTYYWRVDQTEAGYPVYTGPVWSLETAKAAPMIVTQPADQAVLPGLGSNAVFTIEVTSISQEHYYWYKTEDNSNSTPDDDNSVEGDSDTLVISDVEAADEGYYFCKVVNSGGNISSNAVMLGVQRLMAHYTMDADDYVGGQYLDASGSGYPVDPNEPPLPEQFIAGVDSTKTNQGINFAPKPKAAGWSAPYWTMAYTDNLTVSAWVKWFGTNNFAQGIVCNQGAGVDPMGNANNWWFEVRSGGNISIRTANVTPGYISSSKLPQDNWAHVAATIGPEGTKLYVNGIVVAESAVTAAGRRYEVPIYLGCGDRDATGVIEVFNGIIDDVRIYNYAKDDIAIANLYYDVLETPVCINPNDLPMSFDVAGGGTLADEPDCQVNLSDFAVFAADWLNCGLYPQEDCP